MLSEIFLCPTLPVGSRISVAKGLCLIRKYDQNQRSKKFVEKISLYVSVSAGIYFNSSTILSFTRTFRGIMEYYYHPQKTQT